MMRGFILLLRALDKARNAPSATFSGVAVKQGLTSHIMAAGMVLGLIGFFISNFLLMTGGLLFLIGFLAAVIESLLES